MVGPTLTLAFSRFLKRPHITSLIGASIRTLASSNVCAIVMFVAVQSSIQWVGRQHTQQNSNHSWYKRQTLRESRYTSCSCQCPRRRQGSERYSFGLNTKEPNARMSLDLLRRRRISGEVHSVNRTISSDLLMSSERQSYPFGER
jgi:hypothetical protein